MTNAMQFVYKYIKIDKKKEDSVHLQIEIKLKFCFEAYCYLAIFFHFLILFF